MSMEELKQRRAEDLREGSRYGLHTLSNEEFYSEGPMPFTLAQALEHLKDYCIDRGLRTFDYTKCSHLVDFIIQCRRVY